MKRLNENKLLELLNVNFPIPILLLGARQVGKTWIVENVLAKRFQNFHKFNFEKDGETLSHIFDDSLDAKYLLNQLSLLKNKTINPERDLILFDEVQKCPNAVSSLKYFHPDESKRKINIIATGSYMGLVEHFPVGISIEHMFPMNFEEFLQAILAEDSPLFQSFLKEDKSKLLFDKLWPHFLDYLYVGGMPEAVREWISPNNKDNIIKRIEKVRSVHQKLIDGVFFDIGKHVDKSNAAKITAIFKSIPDQINRALDSSVPRFVIKTALPKAKPSYARTQDALSWLSSMKLVHRVDYVTGPQNMNIIEPEKFKLFLYDMGILGAMLNITYQEQIGQKFDFKGYLAENFVACELASSGQRKLTSWQPKSGGPEIEFLLKTQTCGVVPVEVKSSKRTKAKSLARYIELFNPTSSLKLIGSCSGNDKKNKVVSLFFAGKVFKWI